MSDLSARFLTLKSLIKAYLLNRQNREQAGFTLIELLVVIVIIGILASIALPSFLNQRNRAAESEAEQYLAAINDAQENEFNSDQAFDQIEALEIGLNLDAAGCTTYFCYESTVGNSGGPAQVITTAIPVRQDAGISGFAGKVYLARNSEGNAVSRKFICESDGTSNPPALASVTTCPAGSTSINE